MRKHVLLYGLLLGVLHAQKRVPVMIAISIGNGGGDAEGSERAWEYDTMSDRYAEIEVSA